MIMGHKHLKGDKYTHWSIGDKEEKILKELLED